ncbi:uncharacterized protein LOC119980437 [Tripterygium wilfordii]|uniref:uncharacterized protein LOC119980437 n=1 Tax=Tripterygium wilfordii TaxID=458696 RepID=UPI0018F7EC18|nr:uncharacterized protein LOC119980437 [Tripterygium wilfordii]
MSKWMYNERRSAGGVVVAVCEEERSRMVEPVVCPKPRRLGVLNPSIKRCALNQEVEIGDAKAGTELLDMILTKGSYGGDKSTNHVALSPPAFYCGSPPSRASNPVIQDAQFGSEKVTTLSISPASPSPSSRCTRMKFGHKQAAVRVEGFDCLSRDQRNCSSISAVA